MNLSLENTLTCTKAFHIVWFEAKSTSQNGFILIFEERKQRNNCHCTAILFHVGLFRTENLVAMEARRNRFSTLLGRREGITIEILLSRNFWMHLKVHNTGIRRSVLWNCTCLCLFLYCFIPIRTPLELQNCLSFCYFSIFKIPSWGYGLSTGSVYRENFTM